MHELPIRYSCPRTTASSNGGQELDSLDDGTSEEYGDLGESEEDLAGLSSEDVYSATVSASDWTTETLLRQISRGNVDLDPAFQRREAWTRVKQSRYIESLIVGLPVPQVVLAEAKGSRGKFLVLDGKQRLLTMRKFSDGDLKLNGLELRSDLNGLTFSKLPEDDLIALENQTLRTVTVRNWRSESFLFLVFLRLNTGSVPLSPQELRTALHPGPFVQFVSKYTEENPEFARLFRKGATVDFRMRDIELLVRYFAFTYFLPDYSGNLKLLLDATCMQLNKRMASSDFDVESSATECLKGIEAITDIFKDNSFKIWRPDSKRFETRFNRALFDCLIFYAKDSSTREAMIASPDLVTESLKTCCAEPKFIEAVTNTTKSIDAVYTRIAIWGTYLGRALSLELQGIELKGNRIAYAQL